MSAPGYQDIRCPRCHRKLFEAMGISAYLDLRIKCPSRTCRDIVISVREGFLAHVIHQEKLTT